MKKLILVQKDLKVPKGNYNSFGRYKYRSAEDILEAVKPILILHNCLLTISDDIVESAGKVYVKSTAKFLDGENEFLTFGFAETSEHKGMSSEQATGTASSYARKYALNGLF
ncbi:MAG: ERF family protein [Solirubrobacteraceae bacterium]